MLNLAIVDDPPGLQWPETSPLTPQERAAIEAEHFAAAAPAQQRTDELAALRSANALLERRVAVLEAAMRKRAPTSTVLDGVCEAVAQTIKAERAEVAKRFDELDKRVGAGMRYRGIHEAGATYRPGDICTRSGSAWIAMVETADVPGEGATGWSMFVKKGRDSRDRTREPTIA